MNAFWLRHRDPLIILLSFLGALGVGGALFLAHGVNPLEAYGAMAVGALGSAPALWSTLAGLCGCGLIAVAVKSRYKGKRVA